MIKSISKTENKDTAYILVVDLIMYSILNWGAIENYEINKYKNMGMMCTVKT